jgi:hypothetical protein
MENQMIALCASHLSKPIKIKWMNEMIESWNNQTHKVPLHINTSIDDSVKTLFEYYKENKWNYENLFFYIEKEKTPQFVHYKKLCEKINNIYNQNTWVIFTDDDDIWEKDRSLYYKLITKKCNKDEETMVSYVWVCTFCNCSGGEFNENYVIKNQLDNKDTEKERGGKLQDYWQISCQLKYFNDYINRCSEDLLKDGYCNLLFVKYFNFSKRAIKWNSKDRKRFVYYWRTMDSNDKNSDVHEVNNLQKKLKEKMYVLFFLIGKKKKKKKSPTDELENAILGFFKNIGFPDKYYIRSYIKEQVKIIKHSSEYDLYLNSPILENFIE